MGKRELVALLNLSSWCLLMAYGLFLAVPRGVLRFVIVVFPDHTHLLFMEVLIRPLSCLSLSALSENDIIVLKLDNQRENTKVYWILMLLSLMSRLMQ